MSDLQFYAQPYNIDAEGFFFANMQQYENRVAACIDRYGQPVEEFEIQFIDGEAIDAQLFEALGINQATIGSFIEHIGNWDEHQKRILIVAVGDCGYSFTIGKDDPDDFDVDIYEIGSYRELAIQFVEDGIMGDIPDHLRFYIDYDAISRDLRIDYGDITIAGEWLIYRCS